MSALSTFTGVRLFLLFFYLFFLQILLDLLLATSSTALSTSLVWLLSMSNTPNTETTIMYNLTLKVQVSKQQSDCLQLMLSGNEKKDMLNFDYDLQNLWKQQLTLSKYNSFYFFYNVGRFLLCPSFSFSLCRSPQSHWNLIGHRKFPQRQVAPCTRHSRHTTYLYWSHSSGLECLQTLSWQLGFPLCWSDACLLKK